MNQHDIERGLRNLGLRAGDIVLLHSSLSSFGKVEGGAETVVNAFLNVLDAAGTLVVPTFGALGVITDVVRHHPRAVKSAHPLASVAAIGPRAPAICADHWKADTAHGHDTPYLRIAELGGYVYLAGVDQDRNTTLHSVEALLELPYLSERTKTFNVDGAEESRTWRFFPGPHRNFIGLDTLLREKGVMRVGRIGNAVIRLMKSKEMIDVCLEAGRANPAFVLCENPACADCVAQRAAIRRERFAGESFTLAAASGLAGRYVPEMIDNLRAAGVRHVELDYVEGKPVALLSADRLEAVTRELRDGGCTVIAIRCNAVPELVMGLLHSAAESGIPRVVLPLTSAAEHHARMAQEKGLTLSLFSVSSGSIQTSEEFERLAREDVPVACTFNGANFVKAGEMPFLYSYKRKLRRLVDQLDLEDCCFDGTPRALAEGNAEVKEMISILRCANFSGFMMLTSANRASGDLCAAVARFEALLDSM
ncbi:MAG: AAC(3) family N-acetyltransferase [Candidatus Hydrogenedentes bacterium]|nr:AAC(3) family N-acetyltransferase [Candidatus Hydrogenedentota bacterium]